MKNEIWKSLIPKTKNLNQIPGSITYQGEHKDVPVSIEYISYGEWGYERKIVNTIEKPEEDIGVHWYNVTGLNNVNLFKKIGEVFNIHPMDLEDVVHVSDLSKVESKDHYVMAFLNMLSISEDLLFHEHVSLILVGSVLITFQEVPGDNFDQIRNRIIQNQGRIRHLASDYLFYVILDTLIDGYFSGAHHVALKFNQLEKDILDKKQVSQEQIYYLKKEVSSMIQSAMSFKDYCYLYVSSLDHEEFLKPYFTDLLDHISQILITLMSHRDMIHGLYEFQMAESSHKMNEVMTTLTLFSAIFIPLSFLAGVFGMNFDHMPGLSMTYGFYLFLLACGVITLGMLMFLNKRRI